jgi:hypothetical protein
MLGIKTVYPQIDQSDQPGRTRKPGSWGRAERRLELPVSGHLSPHPVRRNRLTTQPTGVGLHRN